MHSVCIACPSTGQFISLNALGNQLGRIGLTDIVDLDRFIPGVGWKQIRWDTLFAVDPEQVVALKLSSLDAVEDWEIHHLHMFGSLLPDAIFRSGLWPSNWGPG